MTTATRDYSITGPERQRSFERGLVDADWYTTPVPRDRMRQLTARRNGPALAHTAIWLGLLAGTGYVAHLSFGTWWMIPAFFVYGTLYGSTCDARWHECGHGTAFRTPWLNSAVYYLASFMAWREAVSWRSSHVRHHSDTIVVGRDPEIAFQRPLQLRVPLKECLGLMSGRPETARILHNVVGRFTPDQLDHLPVGEQPKVVRTARVYLVVVATTIATSVALGTIEPLLLVWGPSFYGRWLMVAYGVTQHAGLAEDTLDHRLNSRTVRMNRVHRFLYLNMNHHIEHHMFPTVPYHALPALSATVAHDYPPVYGGFIATYREIWSAYRLQARDPGAFIDRSSLLPDGGPSADSGPDPGSVPARGPGRDRVDGRVGVGDRVPPAAPDHGDGWLDAGPSEGLAPGDVIRFDAGAVTLAVYRLTSGAVHATDGLCTHRNVHLCDGAVVGDEIECPRHNGRFDIATGRTARGPVTVDLAVHPARERAGRIEVRPVAAPSSPAVSSPPISSPPVSSPAVSSPAAGGDGSDGVPGASGAGPATPARQ